MVTESESVLPAESVTVAVMVCEPAGRTLLNELAVVIAKLDELQTILSTEVALSTGSVADAANEIETADSNSSIHPNGLLMVTVGAASVETVGISVGAKMSTLLTSSSGSVVPSPDSSVQPSLPALITVA